jgi:hypothetical protein
MSYSSNVVRNPQTVEYGKFVEILGDSRFPAISVIRQQYPDYSEAYNIPLSTQPVSSVDIYPKYGVITYLANASDISLVLSASNVDIGDVGILDHYTTSSTVRAQVLFTNTVVSSGIGYDMGALSVKPYGVTPVSGNVIATISEQLPQIYTFHNFGIFTHRGWTMADDLIPMITIRAKSTASKIVKILEYELGNNNANSSTIGYVWYEDATITSTVPAFSSVNADAEYRFYTDAYGSNTPNSFTGGTKRHSGIVIGKNSEAETTLSNIPLTANGKTLTMCVQRLDSATKLDLWTAMTLGIF